VWGPHRDNEKRNNRPYQGGELPKARGTVGSCDYEYRNG